MAFVAFGLNHKTAPIEVREKMALPAAMQDELLNDLIKLPAVNEAAILSTCNRTEIYCDANEVEELIPWTVKQHQLPAELISSYFYLHHGQQGIQHILRVASGLDSMMLGEPQILGQMKQSYQHACRLGTAKTNLRQVFEYTFRASKRVRTQSGIGTNPISIAYAAVQLIGQFFANYQPLQVLLIGSGETAGLIAKYLHKQGVKQFSIASRNQDHALRLADNFAAKVFSIGDIPEQLAHADVVISATACPLPFINQSMVKYALSKRREAPIFFIDLAVPRDIEANVSELPGIKLYNIDDLQGLTDKGMNQRRSAALQAEQLVEIEVDNYLRLHRSLKARDIICNYRSHIQSLAQHELKRAQLRLSSGFNQEEVLTELCDRLVNKLVHKPTAGIKQAAWDGREELLDLTHYLFNTAKDTVLV